MTIADKSDASFTTLDGSRPLLSRREGLWALAAAMLVGTIPERGLARPALSAATPFSWERLRALALTRAAQPFRPVPPLREAGAIDFDQVGRISYRPEKALWRGDGDHETRFFPVHKFAAQPVSIAIVEGGQARTLNFSPDLFAVAPDSHGVRMAAPPGFAGFRLMNKGGRGDWLAFQGASYFRSAGALDQYGLSARGLAINTGIDGKEEFPSFTRFWLERGPGEALTVYALLEGPSVSGAYRFANRRTPEGVVQDVTAAIRLRRDVARLGLAPLTSMFWYDEGHRAAAIDWRPEIHDSDGLALITGSGESICRPLANPSRPTMNSFQDRGPKGFGLLQRDRSFAHYQDDGAFYEKRPNLWVEPQGDWGPGAVMLYEIPTQREIEDNIVAFWTPAAPATAGKQYDIAYRLNWNAADPVAAGIARAVDCWRGTAGAPGHEPIAGARRLVVDFVGAQLAGLGRDSGVDADVSVDGGKLIAHYAYPVVGMESRWRMIADVAIAGREPAGVRAYLRRGGNALSETLIYPLS